MTYTAHKVPRADLDESLVPGVDGPCMRWFTDTYDPLVSGVDGPLCHIRAPNLITRLPLYR